MKADLTIKKEYNSCLVKIDDLLKIIETASQFVRKRAAKKLFIRTNYTLGLEGEREFSTDAFNKFVEILYDYEPSELKRINVDLYNDSDRFSLSFNYDYGSVGSMNIRLSSRSNEIYDLDDLIKRKIKKTKNTLFHGTLSSTLLGLVLGLVVALNSTLLLYRFTEFTITALVSLFWLLAIAAQGIAYVIIEKLLTQIYPTVVIVGNNKFASKGRALEHDFKTFWTWLIVLIAGATILNILGLG